MANATSGHRNLTQRAPVPWSPQPASISTTSITSWVTLPVIIEVGARCASNSRLMALCTPIEAAPNRPAAMAYGVTVAPIGEASRPHTMNPASNTSCNNRASTSAGPPRRLARAISTRPAATPRMNAGNARNFNRIEACVGSASEAPIKMKLPVTWAVNRPNRAMNPRVST